MGIDNKAELPWWQKYNLTIEEASQYFSIGERTLRKFITEHPDAHFVIHNGSKILIKRSVFEKYIDEHLTVL